MELGSGVDPTFEQLKDAAAELTDYAVASRYPDDCRDIDIEEASEATGKAEAIIAFVRGNLTAGNSWMMSQMLLPLAQLFRSP